MRRTIVRKVAKALRQSKTTADAKATCAFLRGDIVGRDISWHPYRSNLIVPVENFSGLRFSSRRSASPTWAYLFQSSHPGGSAATVDQASQPSLAFSCERKRSGCGNS